MPFILSVQAEEDVISIAEEGIRVFRALVAKRYNDELFNLVELVASNPRMARGRHEISPPIRIHSFKAHLVVYPIKEDGSVFVIRIRHSHEDWEAHSP
ncbi:type II toxin-antitoxin system RelE/ParE family toxin [Shinella sp. WSJ-2]|uniref:type II toxin-antitoxin system RelE/ParE family toxin n=1 Tax=Shinella sp. WSJ-2 TaxID=2303749 RepID=UPI000E3E216E|nr:type II toxin-antitoxin system RelE/ParE family toxin [Shinella sp. WSJ-2]RFZ81577.1 type II toxin-antitoxin system RelE/ParE family toxin [Shinella sp. WSJ-2]